MRHSRLVSVAALVLSLGMLFGCSDNELSPTSTDVQTDALLASSTGPLSGAIFTTTEDGEYVNANVQYELKTDVYLDGGPGNNAPISAAGLPEGDYFFQVTDPSGKDLLSTDNIWCRRIHINANGVIDHAYAGKDYDKVQGKWVEVDCQHATGVDADHNAVTVQLYPFDDTPNNGGVYKVWITPVGEYQGDLSGCPVGESGQCNVNGENWQPGNFHGFIPAWSKTDNFKVKEKGGKPCDPSWIGVRKFHDANANGVQDAGEADITGWPVDVTDPLALQNTVYTPEIVLTPVVGDYTFVEATPSGSAQTVSYLDNQVVSQIPNANPTVVVGVLDECDETHEVVYGNVGLGTVTACKVYDSDADGVIDAGEPPVEGFAMQLTGVNVLGDTLDVTQYTGVDGCTTFSGLLPGDYTVTELIPAGWLSTGATTYDFTVTSELNGSDVSGGSFEVTFTNICFGEADFGTKGYWHNKNGLSELTDDDIAYVNGLSPYESPSNYFDACDEPFDGSCADGDVEPAFNNDDGSLIWGAGTWQAEVSHFLVDPNAGGDPREQLAQQLLAFIFNVRHRLDSPDTLIELPDGTFATAQSLIDAAIAAWESGTADEQNAIKSLLDALNNNDAQKFVFVTPCDVIY